MSASTFSLPAGSRANTAPTSIARLPESSLATALNPKTMESLGRLGDSLESSAPSVDTDKLSTEFKAAARHLTTLYRSAQGTAATAHRSGYLAALADIKAGLAAHAQASPNDSPSDTIDWLHRHLSARTDALTTPDDPDEDPIPRAPRHPSSEGSPSPRHDFPTSARPNGPLREPPSLNAPLEAQRVQAILSRPAWTRVASTTSAPHQREATAAPKSRKSSEVSDAANTTENPAQVSGNHQELSASGATENSLPPAAPSLSATNPPLQREVAQPISTPVFGFSLPPDAPKLAADGLAPGLGFAAYAAKPGTSFRRRRDRSVSPTSSGPDNGSDVEECGYDEPPMPARSSGASVVHARPPVAWPERKRPRKPEPPKSKQRPAIRRGAAHSPHSRRRRRDDRRPLD